MRLRTMLAIAGLAASPVLRAQDSDPVALLKTYLTEFKPAGYDSTLADVRYTVGGNLHYLYPLYQLLGNEKKFRALLPGEQYASALAEAFCRVGDASSALRAQGAGYTAAVDDVEIRQIGKTLQGFKDISLSNARKFIAFAAAHSRVVMLNEAYDKPLHRAFAVTLLEDLHKRGFRYLALEMLANDTAAPRDAVNVRSGHYATEPVAGELIRTALDIGFTLVPYEDANVAQHSPAQRDSVQAANLASLARRDTTAGIFVLAGYGHIAEKAGEDGFVPMAMAFRQMTGIDPLTIDQTDMCEESNFPFGRTFYETFLQRFTVTEPSVALRDGQPVNVTGNTLYDLAVIHPHSDYRDGRPLWLTLGGRRQALYVKSKSKDAFLVQAYYQFESFHNKPGEAVPADQTYTPTGKGSFLLYLKRGKYILIFRDLGYKALYTQVIEVS